MTHYLMSVHGPTVRDEFGNYGSKEEMEEAFAATGAFNEQLRTDGYWVIDAPDLDVALELAAAGSRACRGRVEVRPFDGLA